MRTSKSILIAIALLLGGGLSSSNVWAGFVITLQQVGPNVVATGSGAIDMTGLSGLGFTDIYRAKLDPHAAGILTGSSPFYQEVVYSGLSGPTSFGSGGGTFANSATGDPVGVVSGLGIVVPEGYVSDTALSNTSTYGNQTFSSLGVTPGTYRWTWGSGANQNLTLQIVVVHRRLDFSADGNPDFLLINSYRQSVIWYLNRTTFLSSASGPTLPAGWALVSANDFNNDNKPDFVLFNPSTRRTAIWFLNGNAFVSSSYGPTLPSGWDLRTTGDFNADGHPDFVLTNASGRTAVWFLSGAALMSGQYGRTLPSGWTLGAVGDFNADTKPDFALFQASTGRTAIWFLNGAAFVSGNFGPTLPSGWTVVGTDDYNADDNADLVLFQASTQKSAVWFMQGATRVSSAYGPTLPSGFGYALIAR